MAMVGFDSKWQDFPDYILGITKEIWEDRGLSLRDPHFFSPELSRTYRFEASYG